jgi:hypothetical protein
VCVRSASGRVMRSTSSIIQDPRDTTPFREAPMSIDAHDWYPQRFLRLPARPAPASRPSRLRLRDPFETLVSVRLLVLNSSPPLRRQLPSASFGPECLRAAGRLTLRLTGGRLLCGSCPSGTESCFQLPPRSFSRSRACCSARGPASMPPRGRALKVTSRLAFARRLKSASQGAASYAWRTNTTSRSRGCDARMRAPHSPPRYRRRHYESLAIVGDTPILRVRRQPLLRIC